jgi:broad specificity phosphatase PhoE
MQPRIVLIRHGRSAHVHSEGWIDAAGVHRWRDAYDAAGIDLNDAPPPALVAQAAEAAWLVASDLPRAVSSAVRLLPGRSIRASPLLREAPLDIPTLPLRMPLWAWGAVSHARWVYGILRGSNASAADLARAAAAAEWLSGLVREDASTAIVLTHGLFRGLLSKRLLAMGWSGPRERRRYHNWSTWTFERPHLK